MPKSVDDLVLSEGIEIPDDPIAIELMLEQEEADKAADLEKAKAGDPPNKQADDSGKTGDDDAKGKGADDDKSKVPDEPSGPPQAVVRRVRENLHKAEELLGQKDEQLESANARIAELEAKIASGAAGQDKLQAAADRLTGDPSIKLETLDKAALESLRADLDDNVVNFLGKLVDQHNAQNERIAKLQQENAELVGERDRAHQATQQDDIDTVPLLAVIQATRSKDADLLWNRAVAYESALKSDPDWADKSRGEIYAEVGRRLEAYLGDDAAKWLEGTEADAKGKGADRGKTVEDKLAEARKRATPDSLGDLPTGHAAAQHEQERLAAMSIHDTEDLLNKALDRGNLDEVLQRLSTAV